jgi:hypothetical protein
MSKKYNQLDFCYIQVIYLMEKNTKRFLIIYILQIMNTKVINQSAVENKEQTINDYIESISNKCKSQMIFCSDKEKVDDDNISIPKFSEYYLLDKNNYNVQQLKTFAKSYKLKISAYLYFL